MKSVTEKYYRYIMSGEVEISEVNVIDFPKFFHLPVE